MTTPEETQPPSPAPDGPAHDPAKLPDDSDLLATEPEDDDPEALGGDVADEEG